jgi:hypothetical protein
MENLEIKPLDFTVVDKTQIEAVISELSKKIIASHYQLTEIKEWFLPIYAEYESKTDEEKELVDKEKEEMLLKFSDLTKFIEFETNEIKKYRAILSSN